MYQNLDDAAGSLARVMARAEKITRDLEVFADKIARRPELIGVGGAFRPSSGLKDLPGAPDSDVPHRLAARVPGPADRRANWVPPPVQGYPPPVQRPQPARSVGWRPILLRRIEGVVVEFLGELPASRPSTPRRRREPRPFACVRAIFSLVGNSKPVERLVVRRRSTL